MERYFMYHTADCLVKNSEGHILKVDATVKKIDTEQLAKGCDGITVNYVHGNPHKLMPYRLTLKQ